MQTDSQIVNQFINHLAPGKVIDLQLSSLNLGSLNTVRIKPTVIGIDLGQYLLVKFPTKLNPSQYQDVLVPDTPVIVRYILEGELGECVAFSTTIQHISIAPNRLIFLNYPSKIENRQLRASQRDKTHLPAVISPNKINDTLTGACINGYIIDISEHGCLFSFKPTEGKGGVKKCPIYIAIKLIGKEQTLIINSHVMNNRRENGHILVGIKFDESSLATVSGLLQDMAINTL